MHKKTVSDGCYFSWHLWVKRASWKGAGPLLISDRCLGIAWGSFWRYYSQRIHKSWGLVPNRTPYTRLGESCLWARTTSTWYSELCASSLHYISGLRSCSCCSCPSIEAEQCQDRPSSSRGLCCNLLLYVCPWRWAAPHPCATRFVIGSTQMRGFEEIAILVALSVMVCSACRHAVGSATDYIGSASSQS